MKYLPCGTPDSTFLELKKKEKKEELFKKRNQKTKVTLNLYCVH